MPETLFKVDLTKPMDQQEMLEELQDGTRKLTVATDEEDLEVDLRTKIEL